VSPVSLALVFAQFVLIALLASPVADFLNPSGAIGMIGLLSIGIGSVLALAAAAVMRGARFSVLPEPRASGSLIERGPYRIVRHPMYAAVLLFALGACLVHQSPRHLVWSASLGVVLWLKIRREERLLVAAYPNYADYRRRVGAIVPGLHQS